MLFPEHKIQLFPETEDADVEMKSSASAELLELAQRTETCKANRMVSASGHIEKAGSWAPEGSRPLSKSFWTGSLMGPRPSTSICESR